MTHADSVFTLRLCGFKRHTGYRLFLEKKKSQALSEDVSLPVSMCLNKTTVGDFSV